ncbi:MAG TPA: YoaK family protein [Xanthobacteraceae bacterium]|nr:YoaK family protein [Xanthobacteraceae bacterium]
MPTFTSNSDVIHPLPHAPNEAAALSRLEDRLSPLLSVIAGMVDLTGFFTLGNIFTAHVTGNLVVAAALVVRGGPVNLAQALAIPVFMIAVAAVWFVAQASGQRGSGLARLLLMIQFLLLTGVFVFSVITKPSASPHGLMAGIAVMIAVSAMACQYALFRLAMPRAISTSVMTGNLTNTVLSLMDALSPRRPLMPVDAERLRRSLFLLIGFLVGCVVAAAAIAVVGDWAWSFPAALAAVAIAFR